MVTVDSEIWKAANLKSFATLRKADILQSFKPTILKINWAHQVILEDITTSFPQEPLLAKAVRCAVLH